MVAFRTKIESFSIFASIHRIHSLNQGQGSVFMLRECTQSISRIKLHLHRSFLVKNFPASKNFFEPQESQKCTFFNSPCSSRIVLDHFLFCLIDFLRSVYIGFWKNSKKIIRGLIEHKIWSISCFYITTWKSNRKKLWVKQNWEKIFKQVWILKRRSCGINQIVYWNDLINHKIQNPWTFRKNIYRIFLTQWDE
jgi:hypothetical protein